VRYYRACTALQIDVYRLSQRWDRRDGESSEIRTFHGALVHVGCWFCVAPEVHCLGGGDDGKASSSELVDAEVLGMQIYG
jgi:hypothetical protein